MGKRCAYCEELGGLTREHLWPKGILNECGPLSTMLARIGKFVGGDPVVRDVCRTCNNGALSDLDAYGVELFRRTFVRIVEKRAPVALEADWSRLQRWLMKVAFNFARAQSTTEVSGRYRVYRDWILRAEEPTPRFAMFGQVVLPAIVPEQLRASMSETVRRTGLLEPLILRNGRCVDPRIDGMFGDARLLGLRSYYFYIVIPPDEPLDRSEWRRRLQLFERVFGATLLSRHRNISNIDIPVARHDWVTAYMPTLWSQWRAYEDRYGVKEATTEELEP